MIVTYRQVSSTGSLLFIFREFPVPSLSGKNYFSDLYILTQPWADLYKGVTNWIVEYDRHKQLTSNNLKHEQIFFYRAFRHDLCVFSENPHASFSNVSCYPITLLSSYFSPYLDSMIRSFFLYLQNGCPKHTTSRARLKTKTRR